MHLRTHVANKSRVCKQVIRVDISEVFVFHKGHFSEFPHIFIPYQEVCFPLSVV